MRTARIPRRMVAAYAAAGSREILVRNDASAVIDLYPSDLTELPELASLLVR